MAQCLILSSQGHNNREKSSLEYRIVQALMTSKQTCENLLVAQAFLTRRSSKSLSESEENSVNNLYRWASELALPSAVFATTEVESSDGESQTFSFRQ